MVMITLPLFVISCSTAPKQLLGNVNYYVAAVGNANFTMVEKDGHGILLDAGSGLTDGSKNAEEYAAGNDARSSYWSQAPKAITDWAVKFIKETAKI